MTLETTAIFYDGISSVAQEIILIFDVKKETFHFKSHESFYSWEVTKINFIKKGVLHLLIIFNPIF